MLFPFKYVLPLHPRPLAYVYIHYAEHACLISVRTTRINFMSVIMLSRVAFMLQLNGISIGAKYMTHQAILNGKSSAALPIEPKHKFTCYVTEISLNLTSKMISSRPGGGQIVFVHAANAGTI